MLFNLYLENVFPIAEEKIDEGIKVNEKLINYLRYSDNMVIIAGTIENLQSIINEVGMQYGLIICLQVLLG